MTLKADAVLVNILAKGIQGFTKAIGIAVALSPSRVASSGIGKTRVVLSETNLSLLWTFKAWSTTPNNRNDTVAES
jgi:hypothetical protein